MTADVRSVHEGHCHCRAAGFVYRTALAPEAWPARACQCSFCRSHGALTTSDAHGSLRFIEHTPGVLRRYQFGRKTAEFLICRECGVYLGATMYSEYGTFGIVNVRVLHSLRERIPEPEPKNYDDEGFAERKTRRESRWTPVEG